MKMSYRPTPHFVVAVGIIIAMVWLTLWFVFAIEQAQAGELPTRAVSAAQHQVCDDTPRGSQEMEDGRIKCFRKLYAQGRIKIDRGLVGIN